MKGKLFISTLRISLGISALILTAGMADSAAAALEPAAVLTTAEQVHRLTREEAQRGHSAKIRGVVTCSLPQFAAVVIQDSTRGIYVDHLGAEFGDPPAIGEVLEVEGITHPGDFAPSVEARRIARLGVRELPAPVRPTWDQLINGSLDTQVVEMEGVVTAVHTNGVTLLTHGGKIRAQLVGLQTNHLARWADAHVRVRGCLFATWDAGTHQVRVGEIRIFAPSVSVEESAPEELFAIAPKRAHELLLFDAQASALRRVKVFGQVVHVREGEYYLQDGTNGLRFIPKDPIALKVGDQAEVVGFPSLNGPSPLLREAQARKIAHAALGSPRTLLPENLVLGQYDSTLVRVEAELIGTSASQEGQTLELQAGVRRFLARLASVDRSVGSLPPGSKLSLTGVYAGRGGNRAAGREIDSFELLLNSPAEIAVLSRPPWWTIRRVLWLLGGLSLLSLAALSWAITLNRRVKAQTQIIRQKVQRETIYEERTRLSREFHDTLEQALAGIGMQLEAATNLLLSGSSPNEPVQILGIARSMVRHTHEEARRSVWNLRTYALEQGDLGSALSHLTGQVKNGSLVNVEFQLSGSARRLPGRIEGHLLRIGQEATTNALKHASCHTIRLALRFEPDLIQLSIIDDGQGFDAANATASEAGHFGLLGMRERAEKIGGTLKIDSEIGSGTKINVTVPLTNALPIHRQNGNVETN